MSGEQVTITLGRADVELLKNILIALATAERFFGDLHKLGGNEGWERFVGLSYKLDNAEQVTKQNSVIDDLERQFEKN